MFLFLIFGFIGSIAGFAISSAFVSRGHVQRGKVVLEDTGTDEYRVVFVTRYKVVPQVVLFPEHDVDAVFVREYVYDKYKRFRLDLAKVTTSGFTVLVDRLPYRGKKDEGYVYRLPIEAHFRWRAEGIPDPAYDARSAWLRLTLPQRVFSIAGGLFFLGVLADLVGILGAAVQLAGR